MIMILWISELVSTGNRPLGEGYAHPCQGLVHQGAVSLGTLVRKESGKWLFFSGSGWISSWKSGCFLTSQVCEIGLRKTMKHHIGLLQRVNTRDTKLLGAQLPLNLVGFDLSLGARASLAGQAWLAPHC